MRRTCERPGCPEPVAVVYGYGSDGDAMHIWLDAWSTQRADDVPPEGARGVVCERHGQSLTAPRGWDLLDRRDVVPRLFLPRPVLVHSRNDNEPRSDVRPTDSSAALRRKRINDLPAPQLFSELRAPEEVDDVSHQLGSAEDTPPDPSGFDLDAYSDLRREARNEDADHLDGAHDIDDSLSKLLDATGPLLRRAFAKRNTGRHDASKELMRPTTHQIVDESA